MQVLGLTQPEFEQIIRVCQRAPVGVFTTAPELKLFLMARLRRELPDTAARIGDFDEQQNAELWEEVVQAVKTDAGSVLW
jgi:hypothetical protein